MAYPPDPVKVVISGPSPKREPLTMATADKLEDDGFYELAEIARKYAVDRPRWWHRFTKRK